MVHYYVLSRFLISRMLTVTKIPQMKVIGPSLCIAHSSAVEILLYPLMHVTHNASPHAFTPLQAHLRWWYFQAALQVFTCLCQAVKIALEVKKYLVDNDLMDISQAGSSALEDLCFCHCATCFTENAC